VKKPALERPDFIDMNWFGKILNPDRRRAPRWEAQYLVAYYWDGSTPTPHRIRNISMSGFYLETTTRWHPGTLVTMTIQRAGVQGDRVRAGDYIVLISRIVWMDETGAGVEFIPRELAGNANVRCVGSPATTQAFQQFLKSTQSNVPGTQESGFLRRLLSSRGKEART
jgi:hypothetical protein